MALLSYFRWLNHKLNTVVSIERRVWWYQRANQNPYIEEEQNTQWPRGKVQKDKQRSTKNTYKIKDRVTWTPLKTAGELRCSGRVNSSCHGFMSWHFEPYLCSIWNITTDVWSCNKIYYAKYALSPHMKYEVNSSICVHQRTFKENGFYEDEAKHKF